MCILKILNKTGSYKSLISKIKIKPYSVQDKGDKPFKTIKRIVKEYKISFATSDKEWNDLPGQIKDTVKYLKRNKIELRKVIKDNKNTKAYLDFPIYSRLNKNIVFQSDKFPSDLLKLCGDLDIMIVLSNYK